MLQQLLGGTIPLYIHKIQLQVNFEPKYYDDIIIDADINRAIQQRNRAKLLEEYIDMTHVNTYSPNGKIQAYYNLDKEAEEEEEKTGP